MTQVKEWSNATLNRRLALLMGKWIGDCCNDSAASLEVQEKAIEVSADKYVSNLDERVNPVAMQDNWQNHEIAKLLTAKPRQRAEAAYITLSQ